MKSIFKLIRATEHIFRDALTVPEKLEAAFNFVSLIEGYDAERLRGHHYTLAMVGKTFFNYGYYENLVPLLKRGRIPPKYFYERAGLSVLNTLGLYYRQKGDRDSSDYYFRAMLESADSVKFRGVYDAVAMTNIARNSMARRDYPKAIMLLQKALPVKIGDNDLAFAAEICIALAESYLEAGKLQQTKDMIDSAQIFIDLRNAYRHYVDLYPLKSKYYAKIGDVKASWAYMDSTIVLQQEYREIGDGYRFFRYVYQASRA